MPNSLRYFGIGAGFYILCDGVADIIGGGFLLPGVVDVVIGAGLIVIMAIIREEQPHV